MSRSSWQASWLSVATMRVALAFSRPRTIYLWRGIRSSCEGAPVVERQQLSRVVLLSSIAAVAIVTAFPIIGIGDLYADDPPLGGPWVPALVPAACYLPLHVRHVLYVVRGARPRGANWTLAVMAVLILAPAPFFGLAWCLQFHALATSALLLLPTRLALGVFGGLLVAPFPLGFAVGAPQFGFYLAEAVAWRTVSPFVIIWLASVIRQLDAARVNLADEAVIRERLRIDTELRETLGGSLESIVNEAEEMTGQIRDAGPTEDALRSLVDRSRRTLAAARRLVSGYQQVSLRAELDTAVALLNAAGITTRLEVSGGGLPPGPQDNLRAELRTATARLLREGATHSCVIAVVGHGQLMRLEVRSEKSDPPLMARYSQ